MKFPKDLPFISSTILLGSVINFELFQTIVYLVRGWFEPVIVNYRLAWILWDEIKFDNYIQVFSSNTLEALLIVGMFVLVIAAFQRKQWAAGLFLSAIGILRGVLLVVYGLRMESLFRGFGSWSVTSLPLDSNVNMHFAFVLLSLLSLFLLGIDHFVEGFLLTKKSDPVFTMTVKVIVIAASALALYDQLSWYSICYSQFYPATCFPWQLKTSSPPIFDIHSI